MPRLLPELQRLGRWGQLVPWGYNYISNIPGVVGARELEPLTSAV